MDDLKQFSIWSVVKFDLIGKEFEPDFMTYFDDHIRELVLREGFVRAWRTREARRSYNTGLLEQEFCQIYQIDEPERFSGSNPKRPLAPATEKEPWRRDLSNWGRVFYRVQMRKDNDERAGRYWARYEFDFPGKKGKLPDFRRSLGNYISRVAEQTGVHRAWQLEYVPHKLQVDKDPAAKHIALFEIDAPENIFDPSLNADRVAWPGKAGGKTVPLVARHFSHLLLTVDDLGRKLGAAKK